MCQKIAHNLSQRFQKIENFAGQFKEYVHICLANYDELLAGYDFGGEQLLEIYTICFKQKQEEVLELFPIASSPLPRKGPENHY